MCLSALLGVLQNDAAPMMIGYTPFFDFLHGSKAAEAGQIIIQAAISDARGLSGAVDISHCRRAQLRGLEFDHTRKGESGRCITRTGRWLLTA
jgi:hypothetical protein